MVFPSSTHFSFLFFEKLLGKNLTFLCETGYSEVCSDVCPYVLNCTMANFMVMIFVTSVIFTVIKLFGNQYQ